ncbi:MAG: glycosyltransferase [Deltaproteobacteria bacterium]|jgi:glycosyltransferase involved in cell wall biosynthesis|nr:glycosyltransferase [Deltaproteobacteria bacterium]
MNDLEENYVSAVVVLRDDSAAAGGRLLALDAALAATFRNYEIIAVDNFSSDGTRETLRGIPVPMTVITLPHLHDLQAALTAGVELAVGDYVLEIPDVSADVDFALIERMYRVCQQGNDFVFLTPRRVSGGSRLFYRLMNGYFRGRLPERFVPSVMTLSSRRGQNKTADVGATLVNRNVSYVLTGLRCASVEADIVSRNRRGLRENVGLMVDTLIYHTDYISSLAVNIAVLFLLVSALSFLYAVVVYFTINTAPGWTTQFVLTSVSFGVLFALLAVVCKYLSNIIRSRLPKNYTFGSVEKKENR